MSGANGCREASRSEQLDGKGLRGALGGEGDKEREDPRFLDTVYMASPPFFIYYSVVR